MGTPCRAHPHGPRPSGDDAPLCEELIRPPQADGSVSRWQKDVTHWIGRGVKNHGPQVGSAGGRTKGGSMVKKMSAGKGWHS